MNTSQLHVWIKQSENVSELFLGKFKLSLLSSISSGILENTFFVHVIFSKRSCHKRGGFVFLKRCSKEKTNGWNKALTGMCLLCVGKKHHFWRTFRATFKLPGSGTSSCLAVGFQWRLYKPNQLPREVSTCCTSHSSPSPDRLERHWLCTKCTFPVLHRHSWREKSFNQVLLSLPCCRLCFPSTLGVNLNHLSQSDNAYVWPFCCSKIMEVKTAKAKSVFISLTIFLLFNRYRFRFCSLI